MMISFTMSYNHHCCCLVLGVVVIWMAVDTINKSSGEVFLSRTISSVSSSFAVVLIMMRIVSSFWWDYFLDRKPCLE